MRIHRLQLEGIGPYATRQDLDFDALTASGLFLLTGPTGAGKTTVLDAVVFALYGTVPGARGADGKREKGARERIVSDLRSLNTQPLVELEFSAAGRRFIVRRSPDHDRPKTRGSGTTVAKASATLEERVGGEWVPRSTDFREISTELEGVLGMSAAQFTQVVLLPQGEFAGFLRASVADRRKVLERLFQVDRYESAEAWFEARAKVAKQTLADAEASLRLVAERLVGALGAAAGPADAVAELSGPAEISAWVEARRLDVDERVLRAEATAETQREAYAAADAAHRRAVALGELRAALEEREAVLATHAARLPNARAWIAKHEGAAVAADDAAWAPAARGALARYHELSARAADERRVPALRAAADDASSSAEAAEQAAAAADAAAAVAESDIASLRSAAEAGMRAEAATPGARGRRDELAARVSAAARRDELAEQLRAIDEQLASAAAALAAATGALQEHPADEALDADMGALGVQQRELARVRAELESEIGHVIREASEIAKRRDRWHELVAERSARAAEHARCREAQLEARSAYLSARERRLDAMASELAADLRPGEACAVCGSVEHPQPAAGEGGGDLRAEETAAGELAARADQALAAAQRAVDTAAGELAALDAAELDVRAAELSERGATRRAALEQLAGDEQELATAVTAATAAVTARRAAVRAEAAAQAAVADAERAATTLRESFASAAAHAGDGPPPHEELTSVDAELAALATACEAGVAARERIAALSAEAERHRTGGAAARALVARHRESARGQRDEADRLEHELAPLRGVHPTVVAAATAAGEHAHRLERAAELLAAHHTAQAERDAAAAGLAARVADDPGLAGSSIDLGQQLEARAAARARAAEAATDAAAHVQQARAWRTALDDTERALADAISALGPAAEAAERLIRLDLTVRGGGDNLRKISLATYVLAARLEEVADAATGHLLRMSSGRYELLHHDDRHGGGQAGLGLRVRDGWTGEERDTATLSGGEAFYASLALALGLAEVVTSEAGGRPLDTLLVDEGFGTLDPGTLDEVLGELDALRAAGRSIGLVSHVETLAERIPAQLRVTPGRSGSTATVVTGGATAPVTPALV